MFSVWLRKKQRSSGLWKCSNQKLICMWLRNTSISERIQETELFTSYVPGLQDVGSCVTMLLYPFFLHGLGYKFLQQHFSRSDYWSSKHTGKLRKYKELKPQLHCADGTRLLKVTPGVQVLVSRALPWLLAVFPFSRTQPPNLKDFQIHQDFPDEGKLICKAKFTFSIFLHSFCSPLQVSRAGYSF